MKKVSITYLVEDSFFNRWANAHATGEHDSNGTKIVGFELHDEDVNEQKEFHGCLTGDCPHQKQTECDAALEDFSHATWCDRKTCNGECWKREV